MFLKINEDLKKAVASFKNLGRFGATGGVVKPSVASTSSRTPLLVGEDLYLSTESLAGRLLRTEIKLAVAQEDLKLANALVNTHRKNRGLFDRTISNLMHENAVLRGEAPGKTPWYGSWT